jgi:lipooligosaccharide transport system ATP-binding protein
MDNLDPDFTVEENLIVYSRYFGIQHDDVCRRIPGLLEFAGLAGRGSSRIQELSGGMKRRLTLARALVNDPEVIFMDEPTTGLDPQARHLIWERMKTLLGEGRTILLTTHFMDEAERLCSRLGIMDTGKIIAEGSPRQLVTEHIEPQVVEVYGDGVAEWAKTHASHLADRVELTGETAFCYSREPGPLIATLENGSTLRYLHRHANLEDVFLKLTGRDLRE